MAELTELPITPPPGVVKTDSNRVIEGRWSDTINMRFVKTKPQKIGGWVKGYATPTSGTPRTLHAWRDNSFNPYLAAGTYRKLYVYDPSLLQNDITPFRSSGTLPNNPFTTTAGSASIIVQHVGHGLNQGDSVTYGGAVAFAGILITGTYLVDTIIDADHYTIIHTVAASSDGNDSFTKVLLHCDGADTSTTFTDSNLGGSAHTWTANGNAQIDTADFKFGGASGLFDGAGDYVDTPDSANFALGSSDFTIDTQFKIAPGDVGGTQLLLAGQMDAAVTNLLISFFIERQVGNNIRVLLAVGTGAGNVSLTSIGTYTGSTNPGWHHLAATRSGSTVRLFIDGVVQDTQAFASTINDSPNKLAIGRAGELASASWNGWIDEFRISVGIARWTAAFTPPTSFYGVPNGGNAVTYAYEIPVGVELGAYGLGWGVGTWGTGTWGTAHPSSTIFIEPRVWSLDHFGVLLLAAYNGGSIYKFDPTAIQPWGRATLIDASAPTNCRAMFVTNERFVMALLDGMQVAWASQGSLTIWTPAVGNTANVRTLTEGTKLVTGRVLADFVALIWTDAAVYRFQYTGSAFVYSSSMIAKDCGAISPNGCITVGGIGYWQGQDNFWTYNGAVGPMANVEDIRKYVFDALKTDYGYQCCAVYNPKYNEIWFFYTVLGETNPTLGVIYSITEQCWAPLYYGRCGGTHFTQGDTRPYLGEGVTDFILQHENGFDADGVILPYSMTLSPYAMTKGGKFNMLLEYIVPDFFQQTGDITVTVTTWDRLNDTVPLETEVETITALNSGTIDCRITGRYVGLMLAASSLGSYVRLGEPVAFVKPRGKRT